MGNCQCLAMKSVDDNKTEITAPDHDNTIIGEILSQVDLVRLILSFLDSSEQIRMQILNRQWYSDKGMGLYLPSIMLKVPYDEVDLQMEPYCFMMTPNVNNMMLLAVEPEYELTRKKLQEKKGLAIAGTHWRMAQLG